MGLVVGKNNVSTVVTNFHWIQTDLDTGQHDGDILEWREKECSHSAAISNMLNHSYNANTHARIHPYV